ncbi:MULTISPECIES: prolyl-tRNA synthetase associated domain-containing protein [unclassified Clostridioides]|uniref:prolyl-tRNA synthetase associated domain-containing protein n=1 Tax=unclassified Clostridioides TaxID=2635829 RepID=UPI001D10EB2F|nr:prolyl-tRNA synthetase associated domain-containing protein [Clostridioides sp. ZZV15-6388]MCC0643279.1 prolyl-tRNA synthetase associated domain-containing protein [Clostridioides sp. ZZV14-6150]MCC0658889.1 prolyl-tRNA synthetase associated domain-containing protein [Clostridioides sp. ZZV14-6154]MCC0664515.1 prolyl-tRNA synthetase associated domain-containing protein [Clostridioides sp. ZZV15-6597]MCC0667740.1 prolyl-tRNA synthetase associated domain-containing protein [Clostridioides sp. 
MSDLKDKMTELSDENELNLNETKIYNVLDKLNIKYEVVEHEAVYTAEQLVILNDITKGCQCKNLFLRNAKGNKYYLIVVRGDKHVDLNSVKEKIGSSRLSFASPERLYNVLKLLPGSVNPFSLVNDTERKVELYIDEDVIKEEYLNFHPNINTKTVNISRKGFEEFLEYLKYPIQSIDV